MQPVQTHFTIAPATQQLMKEWTELQPKNKKGKVIDKATNILIKLENGECRFSTKAEARKNITQRIHLSKQKNKYDFLEISQTIKSKFTEILKNIHRLEEKDFEQVTAFITDFNKLADHVAIKKAKKNFGFFWRLMLGNKQYKQELRKRVNNLKNEFKITWGWELEKQENSLIKELQEFQKFGKLQPTSINQPVLLEKEKAKKIENNITNVKRELALNPEINKEKIEELIKVLKELDHAFENPNNLATISLKPEVVEKYNQCQTLILEFQKNVVQHDTINVSKTETKTQENLEKAKDFINSMFPNRSQIQGNENIQEAIVHYGNDMHLSNFTTLAKNVSSDNNTIEQQTLITHLWKDAWLKNLDTIEWNDPELKAIYQQALVNCQNLKELAAISSPKIFNQLFSQYSSKYNDTNRPIKLQHIANHWPDSLFKTIPISNLLHILFKINFNEQKSKDDLKIDRDLQVIQRLANQVGKKSVMNAITTITETAQKTPHLSSSAIDLLSWYSQKLQQAIG